METIYLMIDRRSKVGNSVLFWAKDHKGYTTDPIKAHHFKEDEARRIEGNRYTDCAIPLREVIEAQTSNVDFQKIESKYFKHSFRYFLEDQQKNDLEFEIDRLKGIITEMKSWTHYFETISSDDLRDKIEELADAP